MAAYYTGGLCFLLTFFYKSMNKKENLVEIVPNDLGAKIRVSTNNPEFAHVLLKQQKTVISPKGWVNSKTVHALLHGKVESIQDIGIAALETLPGQIVVKESTTPFNMENPDMDLKRAGSGEDAIICCRHGEPIYRKGFYDATMLDVDEFIAHTNGEDIRNTMVEGTKEAEADFIGNMLGETPKQPDNQIDLEDSIAEVEAEVEAEDKAESKAEVEDEMRKQGEGREERGRRRGWTRTRGRSGLPGTASPTTSRSAESTRQSSTRTPSYGSLRLAQPPRRQPREEPRPRAARRGKCQNRSRPSRPPSPSSSASARAARRVIPDHRHKPRVPEARGTRARSASIARNSAM